MNITTTTQTCWSLMELEQHQQALDLAQKLIDAAPKNSASHQLKGQLLFSLQRFQEALSAFKVANQLHPQAAEVLMIMGQAAQELGNTKDALEFYSQALALEPTAERMAICGNFMFEIGQLPEAEQLLTLSASQGDLRAVAGLVQLRLRQNRAPEAADLVNHFIDRLSEEPSLIHATARLLLSQKEYHSALEALQMLSITTLSSGTKMLHLRLLGETFDKLNQTKKAFLTYHQFNKLRSFHYDSKAHEQQIASLQEHFSDASSFATVSNCTSDRMVFIVGMPRSGSSLLEQILSMHPDIYAAGELDHIPALIKEHGTETVEALDTIAETYLERVQALNAQAKIVTDKLPHNYIHLGELARIFPNARVIYCRRNPVDTGWSCYRQNFHSSLNYSTDLWAIGHFQVRLKELMEHWKKVLPLPILDVPYEKMVRDLPTMSRQVLEHCGLEWNPAVLEFHQSNRAVHTASSLQVQQPLYTSSIGNSNPYRKYLRPLLEGLKS